MLSKIISFFLENRILTVLTAVILIAWGIISSPFNWDTPLPSNPVSVDAIPNIGENQQIVFAEWPGISPQDIENQITYPLTTYLLGVPEVKTIRSTSVFGMSLIYIIFNESADFYWTRSRILEKLNSIPKSLLPTGVSPRLGPDATALGQVFWYTLEGRDDQGNTTGGWDLHEIRSVQDFYVKYALNSVEGVSEVASIGGFTQEYQIDVNASLLQQYNITLGDVYNALKSTNNEIGAGTVEINNAEYFIRGLGYIQELEDLENTVVELRDGVSLKISDIAAVNLGPANRRGILDKQGAEVVGGVVVSSYYSNPLKVIEGIKSKIHEIEPGLPNKTLADGTVSYLKIVPFYDRSILIKETLGTLEEALSLEILISILVIMVLVINLRASLLISSILPIGVLIVFILMKQTGIDANIVALSGIAIAIGTMVDLGIILVENILSHLEEDSGDSLLLTIKKATNEVSGAILTAVSTTIISFIPVFTLLETEGKLFRPLAFTKSYSLIAALFITLILLPTFFYYLFKLKTIKNWMNFLLNGVIAGLGILLLFMGFFDYGFILIALSIVGILNKLNIYSAFYQKFSLQSTVLISVLWLLSKQWLPLGPENGYLISFLFTGFLISVILGSFYLVYHYYSNILNWCLGHKKIFLTLPIALIILGFNIWIGFSAFFKPIAIAFKPLSIELEETDFWAKLSNTFPGLGSEFMPTLSEGSFLYMPTSMAHSGVSYNSKTLSLMDQLIFSVPEVENVVGKAGRVDSPLDPAPISMFENIINYKSEYALDTEGRKVRYKVNSDSKFILKNGKELTNDEILKIRIPNDQLITDSNGRYFRNWRSKVKSPNDIWDEIVEVAKIPGITSSPKLQPIETRLVMLQTGMRAPMGIKIFGDNLEKIEQFGIELESKLQNVKSINKESVFADRIIGKPYIELGINRNKLLIYGLTIDQVQNTIEMAIAGKVVSYTIEGRERYPIRLRYPREERDNPDAINDILIKTSENQWIPLKDVVDVSFKRGPQSIKSEGNFLVGYVVFDKTRGTSEVEAVENAREQIQKDIDTGKLNVPAGINFKFTGTYENQIRANKRLSLIIPLVLILIFLILYLQFKSVKVALMVFSGIAMAFAGGFILIGIYGVENIMDFSIFGNNMRDLFQINTVNLSVAVWVGFIALFGIASDDGVLIATYLKQIFNSSEKIKSVEQIRDYVVIAGLKRVRPALMTISTTIIALLPVLTSTGKGSNIMVPMAIPIVGGMAVAVISIFIVPVLYAINEELKFKKQLKS